TPTTTLLPYTTLFRSLGMAPIAVYEVASFYAMYDLKPVGKHKLCICTNLPCALSGAEDAARHLKKKLGIDWNDTTADGRFTLKRSEEHTSELQSLRHL